MAVRTAKIEIFGFAKDRKDAWRELAISCQRMTNRLWQIWLCHHANNDSAGKLRSHYDAFKLWEATKVGDKPEWPCSVFGEFVSHVPKKGKNKGVETPTAWMLVTSDPNGSYHTLAREFPGVHSRTRELLRKAWESRISSRKSATGSLPGWVAILFANESLPSFTRPQPIPFDKENAKLRKEGDEYICEFKIERLADSKSLVEPCTLMLGKRKCRSVRATVDKILSGEFTWKGSNLLCDRGKWFAVICYEKPDKVRPEESYDSDKVLYVRAGRFSRLDGTKQGSPWRVRIANRSFGFGGNGAHVEFKRRSILRERRERREHYRWAGANQTTHGRARGYSVWVKLSSRWMDFTKSYNSRVTKELIELAKKEGCGRIIYLQSRDSQRDTRLLSMLGNDFTSSMLWDYFQFGTMLASKCEAEGIEYGKSKKKPKAKPAAGGVPRVRATGKPVGKKRTGG